MQRLAIIDLGTNTFHLLICTIKSNRRFDVLYKERKYVRIGEDGTLRFNEVVMERAEEALLHFKNVIDRHDVSRIDAIATAAFRSADNAGFFIERIKKSCGLEITVISGIGEAKYIYEGVRYSGALSDADGLIMDIGGGSVEFIFGNKNKMKHCLSLPIGVSLLKKRFHHNEPISKAEVRRLRTFLQDELAEIRDWLAQSRCTQIIGSSGTFDVLADALPAVSMIGPCSVLVPGDILELSKNVCKLTLQERLHLSIIPDKRADLIVVALILIEEALGLHEGFDRIIVSPYALKEGAVVMAMRD